MTHSIGPSANGVLGNKVPMRPNARLFVAQVSAGLAELNPDSCVELMRMLTVAKCRVGLSYGQNFSPTGCPVGLFCIYFCCSFLFCSWAKCEETWECNEFPRARTSFERALHFRTTPFASVGDILKTVGKQDRRDSSYRHLGFATRTDFYRGYYGTCQLAAHGVSFRPTKCRAAKRLTLKWVPSKSEKQELEIGRIALR
jgi:hypothetical protein